MEKLYDSELKVMEVLWSQGDKTAREIAALLQAEPQHHLHRHQEAHPQGRRLPV